MQVIESTVLKYRTLMSKEYYDVLEKAGNNIKISLIHEFVEGIPPHLLDDIFLVKKVSYLDEITPDTPERVRAKIMELRRTEQVEYTVELTI
jgi:hypothetical protein